MHLLNAQQTHSSICIGWKHIYKSVEILLYLLFGFVSFIVKSADNQVEPLYNIHCNSYDKKL